MHAELLALSAVTPADVGRWRELAARAAEPNPFFEPDYVLPLARGTGQVGDVVLAVVRDEREWAACVPVRRRGRWHRVPLPSLSTWRGHRLYSLLGTPLIASDGVERAAEALIDGLASERTPFFVGLDWIAEDGPIHRAIAAALAGRGMRSLRLERFERAFLRRRPEGSYLAQTVSVKHRRELRRQWRKLGETLGAEPEIVDLAGEEDAVADLIALEGRSSLAARGEVLASNPGHVRFFTEMCRAFAERDRLQLLALRCGGRTLALKCNLLAGAGVFYLKIAYDEAYGSFSPGIQLETASVDIFHERLDAGWMDSCADANNAMINRLWPDRRALVTLAAMAPTMRGLAAVPVLRAARSVRDRRIHGSTA